MKKKSALKNSIFNVIKTIVSMLFPIITLAYASRILGAEGIGKVNFSQYFTSFFAYLAMLGIPWYATREIAKRRENKDDASKFAHEILMISFVSTLLALIFAVNAVIMIDKLHGYASIIFVFAITIVMQGLGMEWLFQGMMDFWHIAVRTIIFQGIAFILLIVTVRKETDLIWYAFVLVLSKSGSYIVNLVRSRKYINYKLYGNYNLRRHIKPILWLYATVLANEVYAILDTVILGFFQGDEAVGRYVAASKLGSAFNQVLTALVAVMLPHITVQLENKNREGFDNLVRNFFQVIFIVSIPAAFSFFSLSKEIITIFCGAEFTDSYITMRIITFVMFVIPANVIIINVIVAVGQEKRNIYAAFIAAGVNLILNLLYIPKFAENAAAVSTVVAETLSLAVGIYNLKCCVKISGFAKNIYQYFIASIPILLWTYIFKAMGLSIWGKVIATVGMSVLSYCIILKLFRNATYLALVECMKKYLKSLKKVKA